MVRKAFELSLGIILLIAFYSLIFIVLMRNEGQNQNANPITAMYWVISTITTLGYGDIVFKSLIGRLYSIIVVFSGIIILWAVILPLIITPRLKSLAELSPSSVPPKINNHIIISGFNYIVEPLSERLAILQMPFLIIERSEEIARSIYKRYPTLYGDPSEHGVLTKANISSARLFITNETDELDAEVILSLREISDINIIELVSDPNTSKFLCYAGASKIISPKNLLGTFIAQIASPPKKKLLPGAVRLLGELMLIELPIYPGCELLRENWDLEDIKEVGVRIVGMWQKGVYLPDPQPETTIQSKSVLMAVGNIEQLSRFRDLTLNQKKGPLIILGYGDVGRQVAKVLNDNGIKPVIVDRRQLGDIPFVHLTGEATSEAVLIEAGIQNAVGIMILINNDSDVIYCTLQAKSLNPNAIVLARANRIGSEEKIYKAGADYVASVPVVASHMLAKIIQNEEEDLALLYEDLEVKLFHVGKRSHLIGKAIGELNLLQRFGCRVIALERSGQDIADIDQNEVIQLEDVLALMGKANGIESFIQAADRKDLLRWIRKILR